MNIVLRIDGGGRGGLGLGDRGLVDRLSVEHGFHRGEPQRPVGDADDADMGVARPAALVRIVEHRGRGQSEVAAPARELLEAPAPAVPARPAGAPRR